MRATQLTVENKASAIRGLYDILPLNEEIATSSITLSNRLGISRNQADRLARQLEGLNILSRRTTMGKGGKVAYWTLKEPLTNAIRKVNSIPARPSASLRKRILDALSEQEFPTVLSILEHIRTPGENIDIHNMTHLLKEMRKQGRVSFKVTNGNRNGYASKGKGSEIPYDIRLGNVSNSTPATIAPPEPAPRPIPTPEPTPIIQSFPLIQRIILRREFLERAALLAEQADEADIALSLLEKAKDSLSPFEQEVVSLWNAYQECKG